MIQFEIKITGRVQGVGFRYFVNKKARELDLKGWVKNTTDGAVLVLVQGEEKTIETFMDFLRIGPSMSSVDRINTIKMNITKEFSQFEIRH